MIGDMVGGCLFMIEGSWGKARPSTLCEEGGIYIGFAGGAK